jgi:endonuclease/exonuclease/phosphatase family metal-dependent hydrolase
MDDCIRLLCCNLRGALTWDGWNSWPLRYPLVKDLLLRSHATVIGFQEMLAPNAWLLRPLLTDYSEVPGAVTGRRYLGPRNPLLLHRRTFQIEASGSFFLSRTPQQFGPDWGARQTRGATWARVLYRHRRLLFLNTHLDHQSQRSRLGSLRLILQKLRELGWPAIPAVLCGDFNASADSEEYALLLDAGFRDSWRQSGQPEAPTFHGFAGTAARSEQRIDWIFHSPQLHTVRTALIGDARPPRYPSDHYPLLADLRFAAPP